MGTLGWGPGAIYLDTTSIDDVGLTTSLDRRRFLYSLRVHGWLLWLPCLSGLSWGG